jgi:hypothetical protein
MQMSAGYDFADITFLMMMMMMMMMMMKTTTRMKIIMMIGGCGDDILNYSRAIIRANVELKINV